MVYYIQVALSIEGAIFMLVKKIRQICLLYQDIYI